MLAQTSMLVLVVVVVGVSCQLQEERVGRELVLKKVRRPVQPRVTGQCSEDFYLEEDPTSCNNFYKCENGTLTHEVCENGLLFDQQMALTDGVYNYCVYNWRVECGDRPEDDTKLSSPGCLYKFGIFPIAEGCLHSYNKCEFGIPTQTECEAENPNIPTRLMLAYNQLTHSCDWPDQLAQCDPVSIFQFNCPDNEELVGTTNEIFLPFPRFAVGESERVYLICVAGLPRLQTCGASDTFSTERLECIRRSPFRG